MARSLDIPLYRYFGLDPKAAPVTTFSIGIDTPEITRQKVREAEAFPVLKIKVGLDTDEATIAAVRSVTNKPLRVDANEGWKNKEEAVRKINWLATQGVEFVEQPMPAAMLEETRWVHERVHLPLIADESCQRPSDIPKLVGIFDGVNVKLDKSGGMLVAFQMIQMARALGLRTMLGCMISSSVKRHRRRAPFAPGELRRLGRQPADRERSLRWGASQRRKTHAAERPRPGAQTRISSLVPQGRERVHAGGAARGNPARQKCDSGEEQRHDVKVTTSYGRTP